MMELVFIAGGNVRKVFIEGRKVSMLTKETGWVPITFNLDKVSDEIKSKMDRKQEQLFAEIAELNTEEEMAEDIIKDFQRTGWRLLKKNNGRLD